MVHAQFAPVIQRLQRGAGDPRGAPEPVGLPHVGQVVAERGAVLPQEIAHRRGGGVHLLAAAVPRVGEPVAHPPEAGPVLRGQDAQVLVIAVHQRPAAVQGVGQHVRRVITDPRKINQLRAAAADVHGIVLHASGAAGEGDHPVRPAVPVIAHQPLPQQDEPARLGLCERSDHHGFPLCCRNSDCAARTERTANGGAPENGVSRCRSARARGPAFRSACSRRAPAARGCCARVCLRPPEPPQTARARRLPRSAAAP